MGIIVDGMIETEQMLLRFDMTAKKRILAKLRAKANEVKELAQKMAPVDKGNLEQAIKVSGESGGVVRDALGRFARQEIDVYVDMEMPIEDRPDKTIGDYAYIMHEHLTPAGPLKLGEKSSEKQQGQNEIVGGKYLERALEEVGISVMGELAIELTEVL
jgi:hypothetical protein